MATQEEIQRQRELNAELEKTAQLRRESVDISSSVIDSLKETLGLQSQRTTFEGTLLKNNKDIYQAILNQRTGLSGIDTINKQIIKNEELIAKSKVVQNSLAASLGKTRKEEADAFVEIVKSQQSLEKSIEEELAKAAEGQVINEQNLQNLQEQLSAKTADLENASENLSILQQQYALNQLNTEELEKQNAEREKEKQIAEEIENALGVAGQLTKLLGSIPGIGKFAAQSYAEVEKEIQKIYETEGRVVSQSEALGMLAKNTLGKAFKALTDPFTILLFVFKQIKDAIGSLDKDVVSLQKNLALSYGEARDLRSELAGAATASGNNLINTRDLVKAQGELTNLLGLQGKINKDNLVTQAELTKLLGIEGKEAAQLQYFAEATGKDFGQQKLDSYATAQSVSSQYGVQLNIKKVMGDVGKASAYNLVQFKGSTTALTEAVAKAQALGTTLEGVNKIAGSLLNFEDSISAELEAELLTGKDINLERARYYALTNDISGLMDEINSQMGDFSDFQNMNAIAQQSFAQSLGMSVGELSDMLLLEQYRGKTYEEIAAAEGEDVAKRVENLTMQEKFNESINKMKDLFVQIAEGPLGTFAEIISSILGNTELLAAIMGGSLVASLMKVVQVARTAKNLSLGAAVVDIVKAAYQSLGGAPGVGMIAAGAAAAAGIAYLYSESNKANSAPGAQFGGEVEEGGMVRVGEVGPEIVQLPEGAKIKPLNVSERGDLRSPTQGSSTSIDLTPLISELKSLKEVMAQQQRAIAQMKVVINPNQLEVGQMTNSAQLQ